MGRLENEARTAMTVLLKQGHSQSAVARMLGVSEGTVRCSSAAERSRGRGWAHDAGWQGSSGG
jgi:transposase